MAEQKQSDPINSKKRIGTIAKKSPSSTPCDPCVCDPIPNGLPLTSWELRSYGSPSSKAHPPGLTGIELTTLSIATLAAMSIWHFWASGLANRKPNTVRISIRGVCFEVEDF